MLRFQKDLPDIQRGEDVAPYGKPTVLAGEGLPPTFRSFATF